MSALRSFSRVDSMTPWTVACQAPLPMEFSRQEYWSGVPFPSPGDLPNPGIEPASLVSPALAGGFFTTMPPGKPTPLASLRPSFCHIHKVPSATQGDIFSSSQGQCVDIYGKERRLAPSPGTERTPSRPSQKGSSSPGLCRVGLPCYLLPGPSEQPSQVGAAIAHTVQVRKLKRN